MIHLIFKKGITWEIISKPKSEIFENEQKKYALKVTRQIHLTENFTKNAKTEKKKKK